MEELQQTNQELHEVISQLAQSNRDIEKRVYNLERAIGVREERIRFLEEELNNAIELSRQDKKELLEEISKLKKINFALVLLRYRDRLELTNTREALQNAQAWNFNENESDSDSD
ncbi:hypothetical protein C2G38_2252422 [Gigaspora rosea]|uniref:Uncharacterized protein n=1 Tax=Gigaspora rosea TaxID=44941 RepID=A0A397UFC5_9GLOM|nr:hypothetical protein C2G38_2252422 [Gigaspora rosea]